MNIINNCLDVFCSSSRQKVSVSYEIELHINFPSPKGSWQISWSICTTTKVVVVALPTYTMQTILLPKQSHRNRRRFHTIALNKFCLPKDPELGWLPITTLDALWCIIVIMDLEVSHLYGNLCSWEEDELLDMGGMLGFGGIVDYLYGRNSPSNEVEFCVRDYVSAEEQWDIGRLQQIICSWIISEIMGIIPSHDILQSDRFIWTLTPNRNFSTKIAYRLLKVDDSGKKVVHNDILTNVLRHSRGLCDNALCTICHMEEETIIHMLRDYVHAKL
ncbi:hypothetical protein CR513_39295, partial [Mucuna pruriens]